jgi:hypothetical protein
MVDAPVTHETVLGWFKEAWEYGASARNNNERWWPPDKHVCRIIARDVASLQQPPPELEDKRIKAARDAAKKLLKAFDDKDTGAGFRFQAEFGLMTYDLFNHPPENPTTLSVKAECEIESLLGSLRTSLHTLDRLVDVWTPDAGINTWLFYKRALQAWGDATGAVPKGVIVNTNEGSPMNKFIGLALDAIHQRRSSSAIDKDVQRKKRQFRSRNNKQKK